MAGGTLLDALKRRSPEDLAHLFAVRPDLAERPVPATLSEVAARAARWASQYAAMRTLDQFRMGVVEVLCLLPAPASPESVAAFFNVEEATPALVAEAFARLAAVGMAVVDDLGRARLVGEIRGRMPFPARLGAPASVLLGRLDKRSLESLAANIGAPSNGTKNVLVDAIAAALADSQRVVAVLRTAPPEAVQRLDSLSGGEGPTVSMVEGWYGTNRRRPRDIEWCVQHGMLIPRDQVFAEMPREIALLLRLGKPYPHLLAQRPSLDPTAADQQIVATESAHRAAGAVAAVHLVLDECDTAPLALLQSGGVGVRELRRVAKALDAEVPEAAWWVEVASLAGLLAFDVQERTIAGTSEVEEWRQVEPAAQWTRLVQAWWTADRWPSAAGHDDPVSGKPAPALGPQPDGYRTAVTQRRQLARILGEAPAGHGVPIGYVVAAARWEQPALWGANAEHADRLALWTLAEMSALGVSASTAAGVVFTEAGRLAVFGGPKALDAARALLPQLGAEFTIQADLTAMAPGRLRHDVASELALMADVESRGAATVYRFGEASLRRAIDAGLTSESILAFLETHASKGVPQALAYLVNDVARRHGSLRVGTAMAYIRSDDPSLVAEAVRHRKLAKLGLRLLAPTVAVSAKDVKTVVNALRTNGFLPAQEDAGGGVVLARAEPTRVAPRSRVTPVWQEPPAVDHHALAAALLQPSAHGPDIEVWREDPLPPDASTDPETIRMILRVAAQANRRVDIGYLDAEGTYSVRTIEPTDLQQGVVEAYCHLRQDERVFAIDRIRWAQLLTPDARGITQEQYR